MTKNESFLTTGNTVLLALTKGVCPICSLVRAFQNELIERLQPDAASNLCNCHAWAIAASAPATSVVEIFLAMLRDSGNEEVPHEGGDCGICRLIREHETTRLRELAREIQRNKVVEWLEQYGTLCRFHGANLQPMLPREHAEIVAKVLANNRQELEHRLESFAADARSRGHSGGGILGRTAEFLVSQRGLRR